MMPLESSVSDTTIWTITNWRQAKAKARASKTFIGQASLTIVKFLYSTGHTRPNKLEQLFLTSISSLVNDLHVRVEPTLVDPLLSRLLTLPANVRQAGKACLDQTLFSYLESLSVKKKNRFIGLTPEVSSSGPTPWCARCPCGCRWGCTTTCRSILVGSERMEQRALKNVNNCLDTNIYSYLQISGGQSSNIYFNVVHFFNKSIN